jgi:hypothetical protein
MTGRTVACAILAVLAAARAGAGEAHSSPAGEAGHWRLIAGPTLASPSFATTYTSRYSPPLLLFPYSSQATQLLPLGGNAGAGARAALEYQVGDRFGLRLTTDGVRTGVSGASGSYELSMRYTSRPPPFYDPVDVALQRSESRPQAEGHVTTAAFGLQLMAWRPLGSRGRLGLAAGPAWVRTSARAQSLVYTRYWLGGHSTLFSEDSLVSFDFPSNTLGAELGLFVETDVGRRLGLRLEVGYLWGREHDATVELHERVNADQATSTLDLPEIRAGLAPAPVRVDPSLLRVSLALSLRL